MNKRLTELACKRQRLKEEIEGQRMELAEIARHLQRPMALADVGMGWLHFLRSHPTLVSAATATLMAFRRKGVIGRVREWWRLLKYYSRPVSFIFEFLSGKHHTRSSERKAE